MKYPIPSPLQQYIEVNIIPRYQYFDAAHQEEHVRIVISGSMKLATHYNVLPAMVYTIAAYHDLGLCKDRETHHIESGYILETDHQIAEWFTPQQIHTMKEAVEDHRASSAHEPRSIYGKIVAEADRDIEPLRILQRTIQFGYKQYPNHSKEEHYQRFHSHLKEKYAEGGYLTLWLPESPNAAKLEELRKIIANEDHLQSLFAQFANSDRCAK